MFGFFAKDVSASMSVGYSCFASRMKLRKRGLLKVLIGVKRNQNTQRFLVSGNSSI